MKEERFRQLFAAFGTLTDCSLKFTKDGKFRKFGFIGFKSEEEAQRALNHFNKSFVDTSRITVSRRESRHCCLWKTLFPSYPCPLSGCDVLSVSLLLSLSCLESPGEFVKLVSWARSRSFPFSVWGRGPRNVHV